MTVVPDGSTAPYGCVAVVEEDFRVVVVTVGLAVVESVGCCVEVVAVVDADDGVVVVLPDDVGWAKVVPLVGRTVGTVVVVGVSAGGSFSTVGSNAKKPTSSAKTHGQTAR